MLSEHVDKPNLPGLNSERPYEVLVDVFPPGNVEAYLIEVGIRLWWH